MKNNNVQRVQKDVACWDCNFNNCYKCFPEKDPNKAKNNKDNNKK